jgi:hypothetical protein
MDNIRRQVTSWFITRWIKNQHAAGCDCTSCSVDRVTHRWGEDWGNPRVHVTPPVHMRVPIDMNEWHRRRFLARAMRMQKD